jgi:citrate lyase subunit beta/citryl-CoA lyase
MTTAALFSPRSVLIVPAAVPRFLEKAPSVEADAFVIDLEDAVAAAEKASARRRAAEAIRDLDFDGRPVAVRVNGWTSAHTFRDVAEVVAGARARLDSVLLPKTDGPHEVRALDLLLAQVERECGLEVGRVGIDLLVETAAGLADVAASAAASPRCRSLALGPGDLAASLRLPLLGTTGTATADAGDTGDVLQYARFQLLVAARAAGLALIDGPFFGLEDETGLRASAERARTLGFDGKWAIHPDQVRCLNSVFSPTALELERATALLAAMDAADQKGAGAARHAGEMIDEASRQMARSLIARGRAGNEGRTA